MNLGGKVLADAFGRAEPEHYAWQTASPGVAEREQALVRAAFEPLGARVLDLGCGEGATLYHLGAPEGACGVDLFEEKIAFARERLPGCKFACASVYALPFGDGSFDHLLVRDLIHHLDEPERFMDECARVLPSGGRIDILEPCRYNPLVLAHALAIPAERGELRSTMAFLSQTAAPRFQLMRSEVFQALPVHRVLFHPRFGRPEWGRGGIVKRVVDLVETAAEKWMPKFAWAYLHVRATRLK